MFLDFHTPSVGLVVNQVYNLLKSTDIEKTLTILQDVNHNLSKQSKELLLWHQRLGHAGFAWVQTLMCKPKDAEPGEHPVIPTRTTGVHHHDPPKCAACQLAKQHKRSPGSQRIQAKPEREMAIRRDNLSPGACISVDQFTSYAPGRLTSGRQRGHLKYNGGTIFTDHSSSYMFLHNQTTTRMKREKVSARFTRATSTLLSWNPTLPQIKIRGKKIRIKKHFQVKLRCD